MRTRHVVFAAVLAAAGLPAACQEREPGVAPGVGDEDTGPMRGDSPGLGSGTDSSGASDLLDKD